MIRPVNRSALEATAVLLARIAAYVEMEESLAGSVHGNLVLSL